jgi:lipopolysaccharide assembly outer membrane protein LptD (OstA)
VVPLAIAVNEDYQIKAGKVELENTSEGRVSILKGGVTIYHEGATFSGKEGKAFEEDERALLKGDVKIVENETILRGNEGVYYKRNELAIVKGEVEMVNREIILRSDTLYYYRRNRHTEARGNVELLDGKNDIYVIGGKGWHDFQSNRSGMTEEPVLTTTGEGKKVRVEALEMEVDREEEIALASGDVKISQEGIVATCDSLVYLLKEERADLIGEPVIMEEKDVIRGDIAELFFKERELIVAKMKGNASGITHPKEGEKNEIKGEELKILFNKGKVEKIIVEGNAEGKFYRK